MADVKITNLTALAGVDLAASDAFLVEDVSASESKQILASEKAQGLALQLQQALIPGLAATASSGSLPTPDGAMAISDAASPTNAELLEYCIELEAKVTAVLALLAATKLMASS